MLAYFDETQVAYREKSSTSIQVRHGKTLGVLIEKACEITSLEKSEFSRRALEKAAQEVIELSHTHKLTSEDAVAFIQAMDTPIKPTERAIQAARRFRSRVVHAD